MFSSKQMFFLRADTNQPYANNANWSNTSNIQYQVRVSSPPVRMIDVSASSGYTVEFHYYPTVNANTTSSANNAPGPGNYLQQTGGTNTLYWAFGPSVTVGVPAQTNYTAVFNYQDTSFVNHVINTTANSIPANVWTTYALVASANGANTDISIYLNGNRANVQLDGGSFANYVTITHDIRFANSSPFTIGAVGLAQLRGYMDELRVSNIARYSGNSYTVSQYQFSNDSNTVLLLHFNGANGSTTLTDSSSANFTVTNLNNNILISNAKANLSV